MHVRAFQPADAGVCGQIYHDAVQIGAASVYTQAQRDGWSPTAPAAEDYAKRLDGLTTLVAVDAGRVIGFMAFRDSDGYLDLAFVTPARIGQGVAFAIYAKVEAACRATGLSRMTVEASAQSEVFFRRQGWRVTGHATHGEAAALIRTALMDKSL